MARVTYQTRTDEAANLWVPADQAPAAEVVRDEPDTATQAEEWAPDETGDAIDFLASIDRHSFYDYDDSDVYEAGI